MLLAVSYLFRVRLAGLTSALAHAHHRTVPWSIIASGGADFFDTTPRGFVAPIDLGLVVGAILFGAGMQISGGCASGTLYDVGSGSLSAVISLFGWLCGSVAGVGNADFWIFGVGAQRISGPISLNTEFGVGGGIMLSLLMCLVVALAAEGLIRWRKPPPRKLHPSAVGIHRILRGSWPLWAGAVLLAVLNTLVLLTAGQPWAVTAAFRRWTSLLLRGMGADVESWTYWRIRYTSKYSMVEVQ